MQRTHHSDRGEGDKEDAEGCASSFPFAYGRPLGPESHSHTLQRMSYVGRCSAAGWLAGWHAADCWALHAARESGSAEGGGR